MKLASDEDTTSTSTNTAVAAAYTLLLGRYWFHTKNPLVREMWRLRPQRKAKRPRPFDQASSSTGSLVQANSMDSFSRTSWRGSDGSGGSRGVENLTAGARTGGRGGRLEWLRLRMATRLQRCEVERG